MKRPWVRWLPAVVVPVAIAAGAIIAPIAAGAADLPSKTPDEVLRLVAASGTRSFSGTVEQTSHLGLPTLPTVSSGPGSSTDRSAASTLELLTGDHTAKVYVDGPARMRVQVLDQLAERDVVRNGTDVWLYDSKGQQVTHATVATHATESAPDAAATTPGALAQRFLAAVNPSTSVTLGANTSVAGRDAYDLVLTPRTDATLVGSVSIAVDGTTGLPLSVRIDARGQSTPAFEAGFTSFSTSAPAASVFAFSPPAGAKVTEQSLGGGEKTHAATAHPKPAVSGTGWDAVVSLPAGSVPADLTSSPLYGELTTAVDGGRAFSTALVSVLVTDDGRVFAGAVPVQTLQAAAAR
jgi:outer membrane lipoprotein-sorting protein